MVLSMDEELFALGGGLALAISPFPPAILQPIPLNPDGSLSLTLTMPADPGLVGARLPLQGVVVSTQGFIVDATNPFALDVQ